MRCVIELFGMLKDTAQAREIVLELKAPATFRDLLHTLKANSPSLGAVIFEPGRNTLKKAYVMSVNNGAVVDDLDTALKEGDRISLLYLVSGG